MIRNQIVNRFVCSASKFLFVVALFFAISPCAGKMYEPKLPEKLYDKIQE